MQPESRGGSALRKFSVLYGHPQDTAHFEDYCANTHMPLVRKIPGLRRIEQAKVVGTPDGSAQTFYRIFEFWFDNQDQMNQVMGSAEAHPATADLANFASGGATVLVSQVDS